MAVLSLIATSSREAFHGQQELKNNNNNIVFVVVIKIYIATD